MPIHVPATVDTRVRRKWSLRVKLIGFGFFAFFIGLFLAQIFAFDGRMSFFVMWTVGLAAGIRYLRVARLLERPEEPTGTLDDATRELITRFETKVRVEGRREVAAGTLSMPSSAEGSDGELSLSRDQGSLSPVELSEESPEDSQV